MTDGPAVAVVHDPDISAGIASALDLLDLEGLFEGRVVAVKPNETWASEEDLTAVTQGDTLRAVLSYVKERTPGELIVSGGAGAAETDDVFRLTGMMDAVREAGAEFVDHNRPPFTEVPLPYDRTEPETQGPQRTVVVNPRVLTYEALVAVNQLKVHRTATVTMALKNIAMSYPAADHYGHPRADEKHLHAFFDDMHSFIAAMAERFPVSLAITVGHPAMVATGPIGGYTAETGLVIASRDAVAADVVGARILGFDAQAVRHLWEAGIRGLGTTDIDEMSFPGLSLADAAERFTEAVYGKRLSLGA